MLLVVGDLKNYLVYKTEGYLSYLKVKVFGPSSNLNKEKIVTNDKLLSTNYIDNCYQWIT